MLSQERTFGVVEGLALFGDHADPEHIYYIPTRPRIAHVNGEQELVMVKYQSSDVLEQGGVGLLSFTTDLSVTEEQLEACVEYLVDQGVTTPLLSPVPWLAGKAYFAAALQEGDGFVEKLYGEITPDLIVENRAMFSVLLNEEGARLVETMLDTEGVNPLGVRYELEYAVLRPAFDVHIRADYKRIYNELSVGFEIGVAYEGVGVRAGVESATQRLIESGAIQIEVLHFTDDADLQARVDKAVQWFQEKILDDMFQSSLQPPAHQNLLDRAIEAAIALGASTLKSALEDEGIASQLASTLGISPDALGLLGNIGGQGGQGGSGASGGESTFAVKLQFTYRDIDQEELKTITLDWTEARAERRTAAPQGLLSSFSGAPKIIEANEKDSYWEKLRVNVRSLGDFEALGVQRMILTLAYPNENDPDNIKPYVFEAGDNDARPFAAWTNGKPPRYRVKTEVHFKDDGPWPGKAVYSGNWQDSTSLELAVHPLGEVPRIEIELLPGTIDYAEISLVQVDIRVDGDPVDTLTLNSTQPSTVFRHRPELSVNPGAPGEEGHESSQSPLLESRMTWFLADGGRVQGEWSMVDSSAIMIQRPWRSQRTLRLFPVLPDDFIEALVTITLTEGGRSTSKVIRFQSGERQTKVVSLPSLEETPPPAVVTILVIRGDGSVFTSDPVEITAPVLLVRDREGVFRQVKVRLLSGAHLSDHGVMAVVVHLLDQDNETLDTVVFTESTREPGLLLVPIDDDGASVMRYRVVRYSLSGAAVESEIEESSTNEVRVPALIPA